MMSQVWSFLEAFDGDTPMVLRGGDVLTSRDVVSEAVRLRSRLAGESGPVFLYCGDAGNFLAGLLGVLSAGRDVVLPGHAAPGYLHDIGAVGSRLLTDLPEVDSDALLVSVGKLASSAMLDRIEIDANTKIGFSTSGSTGAAKLCLKTHDQILSEAAVHLRLWGAPEGPVVGTVSHQHIYGLLFRLLWPLMAGKPVLAHQCDFWEQVLVHAISGYSIVSSPAHLSRISENLLIENSPRYIFSSGGLLPFAAAQNARKTFGVLPIEILGSTETGGVARRQQAIEGELWTPLPDVEIAVGEEGALCVRSPFTGETGYVTMGDGVSINDDGRFALNARLDRIVKVEGKRVSLPRVEEVMRKHLDVRDVSVVDLPDRGHALGAVVVLGEEAKLRLEDIGSFRFSRELRQLLAAYLESMERPKFWRFLSAIPENAQGKRTVASLRDLFVKGQMDIPKLIARHVEGDEARFDMVLDPELTWFDGHFPERPILPGVAQIHIASLLAEEVWGFVADGREMARVKFRRMLLPGERVVLLLNRKSAGSLAFSYLIDDDLAASGTFKGLPV